MESGSLSFCCPGKLSTLPGPHGIPPCRSRLLWFALSSCFKSVVLVVWLAVKVIFRCIWAVPKYMYSRTVNQLLTYYLYIYNLLLSGKYVINSRRCFFGNLHTITVNFHLPQTETIHHLHIVIEQQRLVEDYLHWPNINLQKQQHLQKGIEQMFGICF